MAYFYSQKNKFTQFQKSPGFNIEGTGTINSKFSITYIKLDNTRDPAEENLLIEINEGFSAIYLIHAGTCTFTFYTEAKTETITLSEKEYVYITPGTKYDVVGSGEM